MLRSLFLVVSGLVVLTNAGILAPREVSTTYLGMCVDTETSLTPGSRFEIKSPNYDWGNYADYTRCYVSLRSGVNALLLNIKIEDIDLEMSSQDCNYDYLCVNGARFCGGRYLGSVFQYVVPAHSSFTLGFKTDGSGRGHGFYLTGNATFYNNETVSVADRGSSSDGVWYSAYSPFSYTYTDRCSVEAGYFSSSIPPSSSYSRTTSAYLPSYEYTTFYPYTTANPWYYSTTYNSYSTDYYYTTPYNLWYYQTTYDYQYTTGYYYTTPYYPYSTWYYDTTTYNPCQNGYTTVYCQYTSSSPSSMNDYIAYELQRALQEINSERNSQDQLYAIVANLLRYLGHK